MEPTVPIANLTILPTEILTMVLLETDDIDTLSRWCQSYKPITAICKDDRFWKQKFLKDYWEIPLPDEGNTQQDQPKISWKRRYKLTTETLRSNSPISAGLNHYGIIDENGVLYMAWKNIRGRSGNNLSSGGGLLNPTMVPFDSKVICVSCHDTGTAVLTEDGKVYYWNGVFGITVPHHIEVDILPKAIKVAVSFNRVGEIMLIIIGRDNLVYLWYQGDKKYKQIRVIAKEDKHVPVPVLALDIVLSSGTVAIIGLDGDLYLVGEIPGTYEYNDYDDYLAYIDCKILPEFIHFPLPEKIKQVSLGEDHIAVLSITGRTYLWGTELPIQHSQDISEINKPKDKMGWTFKDKISYITAGNYLTAFITEKGKLYIWGDNQHQQITNFGNKIISPGQDPPDRDHHYPERSLILSPTLFEIRFPVNYIDFGYRFTIAVTSDGAINLWGEI